MRLRDWFERPRRLLVWFLGVTVVLTALLGWFAWRLIELDRELEDQRIQERLETAADGVASTLIVGLTQIEEQLNGLLALPRELRSEAAAVQGEALPDDALIVLQEGLSLATHPPGRLLYYPFLAPTSGKPAEEVFAAAEGLEFRQRRYSGSAAILRDLAGSADLGVRAGALLRLGRVLRKSGDQDTALAAYEELSSLDAAWVGGLPAPLVAAYNRCQVLAELGRRFELHEAARTLLADLHSGRWHITAAVYSFYSQQSELWLERSSESVEPDEAEAASLEALAEAVQILWREHDPDSNSESPSRRRILWVEGRPFLVVSVAAPGMTAALVAGPGFVDERWLSGLLPLAQRQGIELALTDNASNRSILGALEETGPRAVLTPVETGLPWSIHVASADPEAERTRLGRRRNLLLIGLILAVSLMLSSAYFIARSVTREMEVARLQSDFVAAVSHEFRSPLTAMRHMTDLLATGRVTEEKLRRKFYGVLSRETKRLQRLVEELLDFRRMDAGAMEFRLEPLNAAELVEEVASEFRNEIAASGYELVLESNGLQPRVCADREALARALRNLLENAIAYSPDCKTVWLETAEEEGSLAIRVRDRGLGIAKREQREIFAKFARGSASKQLGKKGTGLGLAMVREIVKAHGGEVQVASEPGQGSTFTIVLPLEEQA